MAASLPTPTRRLVLGGALGAGGLAAAALAGQASPADDAIPHILSAALSIDPDAELHAACVAYHHARLHRAVCSARCDAVDNVDGPEMEAWDAALAAENLAAERVRLMRPATLSGLGAKAAVARLVIPDMRGSPVPLDYDEITSDTLIADVIALTAGGAAIPAGQMIPPADADDAADAELIMLCEQFSALQVQINDHWKHGIGEKSWRGPTYIEDDDKRQGADEALKERQEPIIARIRAMAPKTLSGSRAVARCLALWDAELRTLIACGDNGDSLYLGNHFVAVLVRGLTDNLAGVS